MRQVILTLAALLLCAVPALAQRIDRQGVPYRAWDIDAGFGFHSMTSADASAGDADTYFDDWTPSWATSFDAGYFWNHHLKTEVGLTLLPRYYDTAREEVVLPGGLTGFTYATSRIRQTQLTLAGTWQFLDNTFAHPYVSAGARVALLAIEEQGQPFATVITPTAASRYFSIPSVNRDRTTVRVRPFLAFGSKSYFSERTFVRPELVLGFNDTGLGQFGGRIVFGVDF
jgi:hypothetical protein